MVPIWGTLAVTIPGERSQPQGQATAHGSRPQAVGRERDEPPRGAAPRESSHRLEGSISSIHHTALLRFPTDNPSCVSRKLRDNGSPLTRDLSEIVQK